MSDKAIESGNMNEWFSARELAGMQGLPETVRAIQIKASKKDWQSRKRQGRGGGFEYHISALPEATQHHIRTERVNAIMAEKYPQSEPVIVPGEQARDELAEEQAEKRMIRSRGAAEFASIPKDNRKKKRARARLWILESMWNYRREHKLCKRTSRLDYCRDFADGRVNAPTSVLEMLPKYRGEQGVHPDVLVKWELDYLDRGIMALTDNFGGNKGKNKITKTPELYRLVVGAMVNQPHIKAKSIKQFLQASHPELDIVCIRSIQRFIAAWIEENHQIWTFITNPDTWKNVYMSAAGSHFERITALNTLWEMDSTPADWMLTDGRHSVVGCIDMFSRRLKYHVSKTSKAMAVCQVFRRPVLDWGVPQGVRTDNGQDYVSMQFDTVLRDLEVMHEICIPFASEEKGTIERSMRTLSHGILDLLPGFIGHNVAERKQIEGKYSVNPPVARILFTQQ